MGKKQSQSEPCMHMSNQRNSLTIVLIYMDDIIYASNNVIELKKIKRMLEKEFKIRDDGPIHYCLGIDFKYDETEGKYFISQKKYVQEILEKFLMKDCEAANTPMETGIKLTKPTEKEQKEAKHLPFRTLIG